MSARDTVRPAAVAGMFYTGDPAALARETAQRIVHAKVGEPNGEPAGDLLPKALIVPHAGHMYSGDIAASAYRLLIPLKDRIRRVVLLGPAHRVAFQGIAAPTVEAFRTPLGDVALDREAIDLARKLPFVVDNDEAHAAEHSLEVQLPFLQAVLPHFKLAPFVVGRCNADDVVALLQTLWGGDETLILISSDLSHYHPYAEATRIDQDSVDRILKLEQLTSFEQACGALPVNGLVALAGAKGLTPTLLDLRNSGDTAGDKSRVVGYASIAFCAQGTHDIGNTLLARAYNAIAAELGGKTVAEPSATDFAAELAAPGATFVTLTQNGQLRGCIGSLQAWRPLEEDVRANALAAAFRDPRFPPLRAEELNRTRVEVSLLAPAVAMTFTDEADALAQLRPLVDGVILECQGHRSTFLPQVWEQIPDPARFLGQLKLKAGLAADFWAPEMKLWRYEVKKWKAPEKS